MPRTTVNIDPSVLEEVRKLQEREDRPLGAVVSLLLAEALQARKGKGSKLPPFKWISWPLGLKIEVNSSNTAQRIRTACLKCSSELLSSSSTRVLSEPGA